MSLSPIDATAEKPAIVDGQPSVKEALEWLTRTDSALREEATLFLGSLTPGDAVDTNELISALRSSHEDTVFWSIIALTCLKNSAADAVSELRHVATLHDAFGVRQAAVKAIAAVAPDDDRTKSTVFERLDDESPFVRREALQAAISLPHLNEQDLARIEALRQDPDETVASWSEIAIRNIALDRRGSS